MNAKFVKQTFPKVKLAFQLNPNLTRHSSQRLPAHHLILAVENQKQWHKQNFSTNKGHYPLIPRYSFKHYVVTFFQQYGAKIHYNYFTNEAGEYVRYGVVNMEDLRQDLLHWEFLKTASIMQKPIDILVPDQDGKVEEWQRKNLKSALAYSALVTPEGSSELQFFTNIAMIPALRGKEFQEIGRFRQAKKKQQAQKFMEQNIQDFRRHFEDTKKSFFTEMIDLDQNGSIVYLKGKKEIREKLIENLNENLVRQVLLQSTKSAEEKKKIKQCGLGQMKTEDFVGFLKEMEESQFKQELNKGILTILKSHWQTNVLHLMMGKMFFVIMLVAKYSVLGVIFVMTYLFFKKKGEEKTPQSTTESATQSTTPTPQPTESAPQPAAGQIS